MKKQKSAQLSNKQTSFKKLIFLTFLLSFTWLSIFPVKAEIQQYRWVGDVPIINGWVIEKELGFAFDSPNGRIVMIFASTDLSQQEIMSFYSVALAQLGWEGAGGVWFRGPEKLLINKVITAHGLLWRLMLQPRS